MHIGQALLLCSPLLHGPFILWMEQHNKQDERDCSNGNIEDDSIGHVYCLVARLQGTLLCYPLVLAEILFKIWSSKGQSSTKDLPALRKNTTTNNPAVYCIWPKLSTCNRTTDSLYNI